VGVGERSADGGVAAPEPGLGERHGVALVAAAGGLDGEGEQLAVTGGYGPPRGAVEEVLDREVVEGDAGLEDETVAAAAPAAGELELVAAGLDEVVGEVDLLLLLVDRDAGAFGELLLVEVAELHELADGALDGLAAVRLTGDRADLAADDVVLGAGVAADFDVAEGV